MFYFIIHVVALVVAFVKVLWIMDGIEHYNSGSFVVYLCVCVNIVVIYVSDNVCVYLFIYFIEHHTQWYTKV